MNGTEWGRQKAECSCKPSQEKMRDKQWGNEQEIGAIQMEIRGSPLLSSDSFIFQNTCLIMHQQNGAGEGDVM